MNLVDLTIKPIGGQPLTMSQPSRPPVAFWLMADEGKTLVDYYEPNRDCARLSRIHLLKMGREMSRHGVYLKGIKWLSTGREQDFRQIKWSKESQS